MAKPRQLPTVAEPDDAEVARWTDEVVPYRCHHCGQVVRRPSTKRWIPQLLRADREDDAPLEGAMRKAIPTTDLTRLQAKLEQVSKPLPRGPRRGALPDL